jgi:hypothetical protein
VDRGLEISKVRSLLALLAIASFSVCVSACGGAAGNGGSIRKASLSPTVGARTAPTTTSSTISTGPPRATDRDGDSDNNDDDYAYGEAASPADRRVVTEIVRRYYAAAAAGDGAKGCSLIFSLLAEEIPELYGESSGPPELRGKSCAVVMSKVFKQQRQKLVTDAATLKVTSVRVKRNHALAMLSFRSMPQRDILVHREYRTWKIDELLDSGLG